MTGPEHFRRAEELAEEAPRLLGQGGGQATADCGPPLPRLMLCSPWPPPPPSARCMATASHGPKLPGPGSNPTCSPRGSCGGLRE
jgi:hypothetical protein